MTDAIDELKFSPEIEECLREIKAECEAAYAESIRELRARVLKEALLACSGLPSAAACREAIRNLLRDAGAFV
jgi:hypothetical protein